MDVEMMIDEPIYVIIVEDEKKQIKEEFQDLQSSIKEEKYFETVQDVGKFVKKEKEDEYISHIKKEISENDEDEIVNSVEIFDYSTKIEPHGNAVKDEVFQKSDLSDEEYQPDGDEHFSYDEYQHSDEDFELADAKIKNRKRRSKIKHSLIKDICKENPELLRNKESLVLALFQIMRTVKPPKLPIDFCIVTSGSEYICSKCNKISSSLSACGRHYQDYHGPKYLSCLACGHKYRTKWTLYRHEKTCRAPYAKLVLKARGYFLGRKGRNRPFLQHQFPFMPNANDGTRWPILSCSMCSAKFQSKASLESHERSHRGERPYQCELCARAYTSYSALTRHKKVHEEPKNVCPICGRKFKQRDTLITHMYTHGEPRFACSECPRRYSTKHALTLHVRSIHRKLPPPCACRLCPKRFRRMSVLNSHMKKQHGVTIVTRKMYFKKLPLLSDMEVEKAKVILANDEDYTLEEAVSKQIDVS